MKLEKDKFVFLICSKCKEKNLKRKRDCRVAKRGCNGNAILTGQATQVVHWNRLTFSISTLQEDEDLLFLLWLGYVGTHQVRCSFKSL